LEEALNLSLDRLLDDDDDILGPLLNESHILGTKKIKETLTLRIGTNILSDTQLVYISLETQNHRIINDEMILTGTVLNQC
jgi:hypothetical protein